MDEQLGIGLRQDKSEFAIEVPVPHELKLRHSMRRIKGLSLWSWDAESGAIKKVDLNKPELNTANGHIRHRVNFDPKLVYIQALNRKNAEKSIRKMISYLTDPAKQAFEEVKKLDLIR